MKNIKHLLSILIPVLAVSGIVYAGSTLTPPGSPSASLYTLSDVYNLSTGATTTPTSAFTTPGTVATTSYTLSEIYTAISGEIAKLPANKIATGTMAFGTTGTLYGDTDPTKVLTTATYPGTAVAGASAPILADANVYGLCWDANQVGCTVGSGLSDDGYGAVEYCQHLNADGTTLNPVAPNIWRLPTIKEMIGLYIDAAFVFQDRINYWTSTLINSVDVRIFLNWTFNGNIDGETMSLSKDTSNATRTRCVK